jgi:hypothetical protein
MTNLLPEQNGASEVERRASHIERSVAPTTTTQEDITTAGQRRINLIWEMTQAAIAVMVTLANMIVSVYLSMTKAPVAPYPIVLSSSFFLVVGFYFSRTNHAAIGGVGRQPQQQKYEGR